MGRQPRGEYIAGVNSPKPDGSRIADDLVHPTDTHSTMRDPATEAMGVSQGNVDVTNARERTLGDIIDSLPFSDVLVLPLRVEALQDGGLPEVDFPD